MATNSISSSLCILGLTLVLGASLLGTCMANKEVTTSTTQHWGWGWGWGWGWRSGWSRGKGKGHRTPAVAPPAGQGQGGWPSPGGYNFSHGGHGIPAAAPPAGQGQGGWPEPGGYNFSRSGCPSSQKNHTSGSSGPNKIVVGGSNNWNFGFNYSDWALKNGPYYLNDVLVFKYDAPINGTPGHSVYLLPDFRSYLKCDLRRAKQVATTAQGSDKGFEFKLTKWKPHYFACGEHNGIHCNLGMMKFFVMPIFRNSN